MQFKINVNMNDVQAPAGLDPLPPGEYLVEVISAEVRPTSTPGRNQIVLQYRVEEPVEYRNRRIFDRRNLPLENEGPESFVAQRLRELFDAFPGCYDYETGTGDTDLMVGMRAMIRVRHEKDNRAGHENEVQARVARVYLPQDASEAQVVQKPAPAPTPASAAKTQAKPAPAKPAQTAAPVHRSPFRRPSVQTS